jgi:hypothetical protein
MEDKVVRIEMHDELDNDNFDDINTSPDSEYGIQHRTTPEPLKQVEDHDEGTGEYSPKCKHLKRRDGRQRCPILMKYAPKILLAAAVIAIGIVVIYDWRNILHMFQRLILWVKDEPYQSGFALFLVYTLLIVFSMPFAFLTVPMGYAFHEAFEGHISKDLFLGFYKF